MHWFKKYENDTETNIEPQISYLEKTITTTPPPPPPLTRRPTTQAPCTPPRVAIPPSAPPYTSWEGFGHHPMLDTHGKVVGSILEHGDFFFSIFLRKRKLGGVRSTCGRDNQYD